MYYKFILTIAQYCSPLQAFLGKSFLCFFNEMMFITNLRTSNLFNNLTICLDVLTSATECIFNCFILIFLAIIANEQKLLFVLQSDFETVHNHFNVKQVFNRIFTLLCLHVYVQYILLAVFACLKSQEMCVLCVVVFYQKEREINEQVLIHSL